MNPLEHIHSNTTCDLCGAVISAHGESVVFGEQTLLGVSVNLSTVVCRKCRFVFQPEQFTEKILAALYEKDTSFAFGEDREDIELINSGLIERQAVISRAMREHGIADGASVLDVGGGRGECCQHLVPFHRVVVADTTDVAPIDPRIEKISGLFSESLWKSTFDVVVMNHVLEHVYSPTELLVSAHDALKIGGILVVEVPFELYTPLIFRHLGDWRHVAYFCRTTLRQFLEKTGFNVEKLKLQEGSYGARRLPVIRAVARKEVRSTQNSGRNSLFVLVADMISPVVLNSLLKRIVTRI